MGIKMFGWFPRLFTALWIVVAGPGVDSAWAQGTKFAHRGRVNLGAASEDGWCDFRFTLFNAPLGGDAVAGPVEQTLPVQGGLYSAEIDFGVVPPPGPTWLGVDVRPSHPGAEFVSVIPRQELVPVPYALQSAWSSATGIAGEAVVARSLVTPSRPGSPSVRVSPGTDSDPDLSGGIAWLDGAGQLAGHLVADRPRQLTFEVERPLRIGGAGMVIGDPGITLFGEETNRFWVNGSSRFAGPIQAAGGIDFPDGSRLTSAPRFRQPNTLWVSPEGDDRAATRGDPDRPWKTIGLAMREAVSGDAVLILPGRYVVGTIAELGGDRVLAPIRLVGLTNVTVAGFGGIPEIYAPNFGDIIQVESCRNLVFRGLHLRSDASSLASPPHGQSAGISFVPRAPYNEHIVIEGCRFTGVPHAITGFAAPAVMTDYLTVQNCFFEGCGWTTGVPRLGQDGGALTGFGNHLRFINNVMDRTIRGVEFYRWPEDPIHENALISGNIFRRYWDCAVCDFDDGGDGKTPTLDGVIISDNLFEDAPVSEPGGEHQGSAAVLINNGRNITVRANVVRGGKLYGIKVCALTGPLEHVEVAGNVVTGVAGRGIQVTDYGPGVRHVRIFSNRTWANTGGGILASGQFLDVSFNTVVDNFPFGIQLTGTESGRLSAWPRVFGNLLDGNAAGILHEGVTNLVSEANRIVDPPAAGDTAVVTPDPGEGTSPGPTHPAAPAGRDLSTPPRRHDALAASQTPSPR
jgi:hypothetical protein